MAIDGIIFDFNGTLFKDGHYHVKAWQIISEQITGQKMSVQEINEKTHGACNEVTIDRLSDGRFSKEENFSWSCKKEALYREMVKEDYKNHDERDNRHHHCAFNTTHHLRIFFFLHCDALQGIIKRTRNLTSTN